MMTRMPCQAERSKVAIFQQQSEVVLYGTQIEKWC
jgi:hypothetical protein